jgi:hypothetical protein
LIGRICEIQDCRQVRVAESLEFGLPRSLDCRRVRILTKYKLRNPPSWDCHQVQIAIRRAWIECRQVRVAKSAKYKLQNLAAKIGLAPSTNCQFRQVWVAAEFGLPNPPSLDCRRVRVVESAERRLPRILLCICSLISDLFYCCMLPYLAVVCSIHSFTASCSSSSSQRWLIVAFCMLHPLHHQAIQSIIHLHSRL